MHATVVSLPASPPVRQAWQHAADAMPQLICLLDASGHVLQANRTLERWGLGPVEQARGLALHQALHPRCSDPDCYLRLFWRRNAGPLRQSGRADCHVWDPLLKRHFEIRTVLPLAQEDANPAHFFALLTIDDVSHLKSGGHRAREAAQMLNRRIACEVHRRVQADKAQSHLSNIMDKTPMLIGMSDHLGDLFYLNPAGRSLLGLSAQDSLAGLSLSNCQAPQERARIEQQALPTARREGNWSGDSVLSSRSGREIRAHLTLLSHHDEQGDLNGFTLMGRDTSDWVRADEALSLTQNEVWRLAAQHLTIQESERRRIALDLHDGLGQTLSLVKLSVEEALRSVNAGSPAQAAQTLSHIGPTVKSALDELRRIAMNLRPSTLDDLGVVATLSWYFRELESACPQMTLQREVNVLESDVPELLKITIFRIVQEASGNALKHARAQRLRVSLQRRDGTLALLIEDDGQGFEPELASSKHEFGRGLGLQSMRERAELSGANYLCTTAPGKGTRIEVRWPTPEAFERTLDALGSADTTPHQVRSPVDRRMQQRYAQYLTRMNNQRNP